MTFKKIKINAIGFIYHALGSLAAFCLFTFLWDKLQAQDYKSIVTLLLPILAALFGFTALMYNRGKSLSDGALQRRSLYAAERALQSVLCFLYAICAGSVIIYLGNFLNLQYLIIPALIISLVLFVMSFMSFYLALRSISHRSFKWLYMRSIIKQIKK